MMYGSLPKETLAEVLLYLAENESFPSLKGFASVSRKKLIPALTELAEALKKETQEDSLQLDKLNQELKSPYREIVSKLDTTERRRLLKGFYS